MRPILNLLVLDGYPILEQLKLEEALLRNDTQDWCLINRGSDPAIVLGISAKVEEVVDENALKRQPIPLVRRYSGGGTVYVDKNTLFSSLILNRSTAPSVQFPKEAMEYAQELFQGLPFCMKENDFVIGDRKCGGNAQYFTKNRFVHHTSFLWDYTSDLLEYLRHPPKMPEYRDNRPHHQFLCTLKPYFCTQVDLSTALIAALGARFELLHRTLQEAEEFKNGEHRISTALVSC